MQFNFSPNSCLLPLAHCLLRLLKWRKEGGGEGRRELQEGGEEGRREEQEQEQQEQLRSPRSAAASAETAASSLGT